MFKSYGTSALSERILEVENTVKFKVVYFSNKLTFSYINLP